ncbi:hypothetical protein OB955_18445 [Halobacteria archaeon AArc-m2/3/4]|uniref:Uncharacterized protein n=1 Tax=Natronoglomus mannanivorans TaxID=2979990 RepID=A0AAP2Z1P8_9EURY|nr:hypothetical protein [Halobacteria archaeon AArc-xg1-1]MCU4974702.1 hypothetical protein [Halobacteria archaeon AArc-m2/3/4]
MSRNEDRFQVLIRSLPVIVVLGLLGGGFFASRFGLAEFRVSVLVVSGLAMGVAALALHRIR